MLTTKYQHRTSFKFLTGLIIQKTPLHRAVFSESLKALGNIFLFQKYQGLIDILNIINK